MAKVKIDSGTLLASVWDQHKAYLLKADPSLALAIEENVVANRDAHQKRMHEAFDKVANPNDWRASIDAVVETDNPAEIEEAIIHFTGDVPTVTREDCGCHFRFWSVGYRNGPCGP